jgi:hypothetical protein
MTDERLILLSPADNVLVLREPIEAGESLEIEGTTLRLAARLRARRS